MLVLVRPAGVVHRVHLPLGLVMLAMAVTFVVAAHRTVGVEAGEVVWRCYLDRGIGDLWVIRDMPSFVLIDADGIIRRKDLKLDELDGAVEALRNGREP